MPTQIIANRSRSSRPNAVSVGSRPALVLHPTSSPHPTSTARSSTELTMSAALRPTTTAGWAIGMERNRSVTPLALSAATAEIVAAAPNIIVCANMPGIRNSR